MIFDRRNKISSRSKAKKAIIGVISIIVAAGICGGTFFALNGRSENVSVESAYREYTASKGSVTVGISESGTASVNRFYISFPVSAEVEEVYVKVGSVVKSGDKIAKLSTDDIDEVKTQYESQLFSAKLELDAAITESKTKLAQVENTYRSKLTRIRNEKIGFIFQKYHLINKYSVLRNVEIPLLLRGYSQKEASAAAEEKLARLGMEKRLAHKPNELSGGQQQRAAITRALVGKPALLLADEPTGALDSATGKEVLELFSELHREGNTIVMITHDLNVAKNAERIVHIVDGEISDD